MASGNCDPQPGDLIEVQRKGYEHWALYVGDGSVIHVTLDGEASSRSDRSTSGKRGKAVVRKQLLKEVARKDDWVVNNKLDSYWTPLPVEKIIQRAESYIDKDVTYIVFSKNCEHFVTMLRYGEGVSHQVWKALPQGLSIVGAVGTMGIARVAGAGLAAAAAGAAGAAVIGGAIGVAIVGITVWKRRKYN